MQTSASHLSVLGLRPLEYLCLIPAKLSGEAVRLFTNRGDFLEIVLQQGRKVSADGHERLLAHADERPQRVKDEHAIARSGGDLIICDARMNIFAVCRRGASL